MSLLSSVIKDSNWNDRLRFLRLLKGWSQDAVAEKCGTNQKHYWEWEKGIKYPRKYNRKMLCKVFEVSEEEIFTS